jgi:hypothetical protein
VSYSVRFEGSALVQPHGMASAAFDALVERVIVLVDAPWDAAMMPAGADPAYRVTTFGSGYGLLTFHADDSGETIRIDGSGAFGAGPSSPLSSQLPVLGGASDIQPSAAASSLAAACRAGRPRPRRRAPPTTPRR